MQGAKFYGGWGSLSFIFRGWFHCYAIPAGVELGFYGLVAIFACPGGGVFCFVCLVEVFDYFLGFFVIGLVFSPQFDIAICMGYFSSQGVHIFIH